MLSGFLPSTFKKLIQMNSKTNNPAEKGNSDWRDISPRKIYKQPASIWRDAHHHKSSGKYTCRDHNVISPHMHQDASHRNCRKQQCCKGNGDIETQVHCWWEGKTVQPLLKNCIDVLQKHQKGGYIFSTNPTWGYLSKTTQSRSQRNIWTPCSPQQLGEK